MKIQVLEQATTIFKDNINSINWVSEAQEERFLKTKYIYVRCNHGMDMDNYDTIILQLLLILQIRPIFLMNPFGRANFKRAMETLDVQDEHYGDKKG